MSRSGSPRRPRSSAYRPALLRCGEEARPVGEEGAASRRAIAVGLARQAYVNLGKARRCYEDAMLLATNRGATFAELARALGLSEPAVRGFVRRAQKRRARGRADA